MRTHVIGLPHTQFDSEAFSTCAFTAKAVRTNRMLKSRGYETVVYWGGDLADVSLMSVEEQHHYWGEWSLDNLPLIHFDPERDYWKVTHERMIAELQQRLEPGDIIAFVMGGSCATPIIQRFGDRHTCVEWGVGYEGICPNNSTLACFESYAWMHNRYGAYGIGDGRAFDTVIPNAVDPDAWYMAPSKGYALFVGRLIMRKGPHVAAQIANAAGLKLIMAGGGVAYKEPGRIVATDGTEITGDVEHIGAVNGESRKRLFAEAEVFICPTLYIGPWEGVHAEAMMSGVPVVAPDYGVFTETLPRCNRYRSMGDALKAIANSDRGLQWREHAIEICGIEHCADRYDDWFQRIQTLRTGKGWYEV